MEILERREGIFYKTSRSIYQDFRYKRIVRVKYNVGILRCTLTWKLAQYCFFTLFMLLRNKLVFFRFVYNCSFSKNKVDNTLENVLNKCQFYIKLISWM